MPIGYDDVKSIFKDMDPNKRFEIYRRIPSLRSAERATPLKIGTLDFSDNENHAIIVDDTKYIVGVHEVDDSGNRKYDEKKEENCYMDVDKYGFRLCHSQLAEQDAGDIFIVDERREESEEAHRKLYTFEKDLAYYTKRLKMLRISESSRKQENIEECQRNIDVTRRRMQPYINKRNGIKPKFEIQLKIVSKEGTEESVERVEYTKKRREALKSLMNVMFEKRPCPVQVKKLKVDERVPLRLPVGVEFKIQELVFNCFNLKDFILLAMIIDESSFPLRKLTIIGSEENFQHKIVNEAKEVVIHEFKIYPIEVFLNLSNKKMTLIDRSQDWNFVDISQLIENWKEVQKEVGTRFAVEMKVENAQNVIEMVEEEIEGSEENNGLVIIPMNESSQLHMRLEPLGQEDRMFSSENRILLTMEVSPLEDSD